MEASFSIRKYQSRDNEECRNLLRELTERHREIYHDPTIGGVHPEDYFDRHLGKVGSENLWVAISDSKVVGLIGLMFEENEAEIEPLIVSKTERRKGIGKELITTVIQEARRSGIRYLDVKPVARNIEAIRFLYEQGFKNLGFIEMFIDFTERPWEQGPTIFGHKFKY